MAICRVYLDYQIVFQILSGTQLVTDAEVFYGWPVKKWVLVCWWQHFDWSFASLIAPVVITTSISLRSNKIQN